MRRHPIALAGVLLAALLAVGPGCSAGEPDEGDSRRTTELAEPDDVVDEELMLGLAQAENFHRKADVYLKDGDVDRAIESVRQVLSVHFPPDAPEGEEVLLDARARLAKLLLSRGEVDEAMTIVEQGIESASRESYFLGNLYTVEGEVHEARAVLLDEDDPEEARAERRAAIEALSKANEIYEARQKDLVQEATR